MVVPRLACSQERRPSDDVNRASLELEADGVAQYVVEGHTADAVEQVDSSRGNAGLQHAVVCCKVFLLYVERLQ